MGRDTYPDPDGPDGSPETLVPILVARTSELVLPLWPVGWVMIVVNELVTVLVIDMVKVASTLDRVNALVRMVKVGRAELGELEAGVDGVAAAEEPEIGCPGVPGTDEAGRMGAMEEPGADCNGDVPVVPVTELPVLDGAPVGPVYPGPEDAEGLDDEPVEVGTPLLFATLLEVPAALEEPALGEVKPGMVGETRLPVVSVAMLKEMVTMGTVGIALVSLSVELITAPVVEGVGCPT
jgi:hypothetical protein